MNTKKHLTNALFVLVFGLFLSTISTAQTRINSSYAFQTNPAKKYSLYIPSNYNPAVPNKLMLGLHPLNTARWDGEAWCDTLIQFAEANNLLLVCPDGGTDGRIDDAIDTAFTSNLLDSVAIWYNVNAAKTYVMGFSWGGKTTYTYGLSHANRFGGFLPIGSAMSGTSEVSGSIANATGKPFYLVHGSFDSPSNRYTPIYNALNNNGALLNSILMSGVGHTIDFPNRNQILTTAFEWIDSVNCSMLLDVPTTEKEAVTTVEVYPNPTLANGTFTVNYTATTPQAIELRLYDLLGNEIRLYSIEAIAGSNQFQFPLKNIPAGNYLLQLKSKQQQQTTAVIIQDKK